MKNIAIDGFTGSGKSTLAKILAEKLGYKILDTGAIFRAFAYSYLNQIGDELTDKKVSNFVKKAHVEVIFEKDGQHTLFNGQDVTEFLRSEIVSQMASKISVFPVVREKYLEIAKNFAKSYDCVMEGRDIGTVVMPNADVKIFLTATQETRAKRRYIDIKKKDKKAKLSDILADLQQRDERDSTRDIAPLKPCEDSIIVDNSFMNLDETADYCLDIIKDKINSTKVTNITIDGYVCSGKSSIAKALAKELDFKVFDTGAVYRAVACAFEYMNLSESKISQNYIEKFSKQINIDVEFIDGLQHVIVNGIDHTQNLRTESISALSAKISPFQCIRDKVLKLQRDFASKNNLVMEGRDIGSTVLPNADFKFFCTADENVRAKRRYEQQKRMGNEVEFDDVLEELRARDYADVHREHGAITKLPESIVIDTTNQSLQQSVEFCLKEMKKRGFKQ